MSSRLIKTQQQAPAQRIGGAAEMHIAYYPAKRSSTRKQDSRRRMRIKWFIHKFRIR